MKWIDAKKGLGGRTVWYSGNTSYAAGWIIQNDHVYRGVDLVNYLDKIGSLADLEIQAGEFALVKEAFPGVELKSDTIASIPIFYTTNRDELCVSPDPYSLLKLLGGNQSDINREQLATLLACGMSLGRESIHQGISRIQANETLQLTRDGFKSLPRNSMKISPTLDYGSAKEEGRRLLEQAVSRTLRSIGDREICIPLSGGMDSRLLAFLLQNKGGNAISCFSYGRRDSFESERSERVSKELGLDWRFVEYAPKKWKIWWEDERYQDYRTWANLLTAIEHERN